MTSSSRYRAHIAKSLLANKAELWDLWQQEVQAVVGENNLDAGTGYFQLDDLASIVEQINLILVNPDEPPSQTGLIIEQKARALGNKCFAQSRSVTQLSIELNSLAAVLEQAIVDATGIWDAGVDLHEAMQMMCITSDTMRKIKHVSITACAQQNAEHEELAEQNRIASNLDLAHEIRSPLQAAMLNADLLIDDDQLPEDCLMKLQQESAQPDRK